jgi:C4-type Zn-finger protein
MAKRAKKHKQFVIKCAHCLECDFKLNDVNPDEQLKYYTDTPFKQALVQTP